MWGSQAVRPELEPLADVDLRAKLGEGVDVRVEPAPADHVAAGRRHARAAQACEQRAGEQERRADLARERRVQLVRGDVGCMDADLVLADPLRVRAERGDQSHHRVDVADPRHVAQHDRLAREQAGGEHRQRAVLVPGGANPAAQGVAALDHEGLGERVFDGSLGHAEGLS
jgi:hypothetical protein